MAVLLRRRRRAPGRGYVLQIVAVDRHKSAHALGPQGRAYAGGASAPVIARQQRLPDAKRIHEVTYVRTERGLLTGSWRRWTKKSRRSIATQPGHQNAIAAAGKHWRDAIPIMRIGWPAMQQNHRRTIGRPAFVIG